MNKQFTIEVYADDANTAVLCLQSVDPAALHAAIAGVNDGRIIVEDTVSMPSRIFAGLSVDVPYCEILVSDARQEEPPLE